MVKSAMEQNFRPLPKCKLSATNHNFPKQKHLLRTKERYVSRTAIKVNTTDTRFDLLRVESLHTLFPIAVGPLRSQLALLTTKFHP